MMSFVVTLNFLQGTLWQFNTAMERSTIFHGKNHFYYDWAMASSSQTVNVYRAGYLKVSQDSKIPTFLVG
jgi:hypothetical protein